MGIYQSSRIHKLMIEKKIFFFFYKLLSLLAYPFSLFCFLQIFFGFVLGFCAALFSSHCPKNKFLCVQKIQGLLSSLSNSKSLLENEWIWPALLGFSLLSKDFLLLSLSLPLLFIDAIMPFSLLLPPSLSLSLSPFLSF